VVHVVRTDFMWALWNDTQHGRLRLLGIVMHGPHLRCGGAVGKR